MPQLRIASALLTQFFVWDFTKQGGAIGNYTTGIDLPNNAVVLQATSCFFCSVAITGAPDLTLGFLPGAGNLTGFWTVAGAATTAGLWQAPTAAGTNLLMNNTQDVIFSIATNPMTTGKIICYIQYFVQ